MKKSAQVLHRGFTLVELLVVIAIIAILAAIVVLIVNPLELTKRGRDAARLTDLANLQQAINVAVQEAADSAADILCGAGAALPCSGSSNTGTRASDGTGWVKVNLSSQNSVSVPTLPVDPTNSLVNHYAYCSDGNDWEINANLESAQQTTSPNDKRANDGGNDVTLYEVGSNLSLIAAADGNCSY